MGSVRASLAKSALDRTVAAEVDTASRAVVRALQACRVARRGEQPPPRIARVMRELERARGALASVSKSSPGWDPNDPDLMSEESRAEQWRLQRAQERLAEEEEKARQAAEEAERLAAEESD